MAVGLFSKRQHIDPQDVEALRIQLHELQQALRAAEIDREQLRAQLDQLTTRPKPIVEDHEVRRRVDALTTSLTAMDTLRERIDALDQRLDNVGTELANQITELGGDIDALADAPSNKAAGANEDTLARISALSESQVRLTNEQARYQIAFREDLAKLAEQVRSAQRR